MEIGLLLHQSAFKVWKKNIDLICTSAYSPPMIIGVDRNDLYPFGPETRDQFLPRNDDLFLPVNLSVLFPYFDEGERYLFVSQLC